MRRQPFLRATVALCSCAVVTACSSDPEPAADGRPDSVPASSPAEITSSGSAEPSPASAPSGPPQLSEYGEERLEPGTYAFLPYGVDLAAPTPVLKIPEGYAGMKGFAVANVAGAGFRSVMVWTVDAVYKQPCNAGSAEPIGPSPEKLAQALSEQQGTTASEPQPVRLSGQRALYLELRAPTGDAFTRCADRYNLWNNDIGGARYLQAPGQVERLWILDTPGERLVIEASHTPQVEPAHVRELTGIVESVRFLTP